ncbi:MAG: MJ0042-type zinc finger domain-containing protein, partial [Planctomycetota bacterium]
MHIQCPHCFANYKVSDDLDGKRAKRPKCQHSFQVARRAADSSPTKPDNIAGAVAAKAVVQQMRPGMPTVSAAMVDGGVP